MNSKDTPDRVRTAHRRNVFLAVAVASAFGLTALKPITGAQAQGSPAVTKSAISEQQAHAIGVDAYLYFYPLVSVAVSRRMATNVDAGKNSRLWPSEYVPQLHRISHRRQQVGGAI